MRLTLAVLLTWLVLSVHIYGLGGAFNHGVYVSLPMHHMCGFEWQGTVGGFCDVDY